MNIYAENQGKTDCEKFKWIIAEIDYLMNLYVPSWDDRFQAWHIKAERFIIKKFGKDSFEHQKFLDVPFEPSVVTNGADEESINKMWCEEGLRTCRLLFNTFLEDMDDNTVDIQDRNIENFGIGVKPMKYIHERVDRLIKKCESCRTESTYDEIIYELDELLVSLVGKSHNSYKNFNHNC